MTDTKNRLQTETESHQTLIARKAEAAHQAANQFLDGTIEGSDLLAIVEELEADARCFARYLARQQDLGFLDALK